MTELILTIAALLVIGVIVWSKESARKSFDVMVPRDIQKGAQHAANTSRKSQVVVFDGSTFDIMRADNQHAARGEIAMIFHPDRELWGIKVGDCLKPNQDRKGGTFRSGDIMVGGVMCDKN